MNPNLLLARMRSQEEYYPKGMSTQLSSPFYKTRLSSQFISTSIDSWACFKLTTSFAPTSKATSNSFCKIKSAFIVCLMGWSL
jgi:hypothetical protein